MKNSAKWYKEEAKYLGRHSHFCDLHDLRRFVLDSSAFLCWVSTYAILSLIVTLLDIFPHVTFIVATFTGDSILTKPRLTRLREITVGSSGAVVKNIYERNFWCRRMGTDLRHSSFIWTFPWQSIPIFDLKISFSIWESVDECLFLFSIICRGICKHFFQDAYKRRISRVRQSSP